MKRKLLVLAGPSGGGKNYITDKLIETYPELFEQLPQYTTRKKRTPDENTYYFINQEHYDIIKKILIAKTEINGFQYGTVPSMKDDKIGIIIANREGIDDLKEYINDENSDIDFEVFFLGIDSNNTVKREGRSEAYVESERTLLKEVVKHWMFNNAKEEKYISPEDVLYYLSIQGFIQPKDKRKVEILEDGVWSPIEAKNTKPGMIVRMFENDGTPIPFNPDPKDFSDEYEYIITAYPEFKRDKMRWAMEISITPQAICERYGKWLGTSMKEFNQFLEDYPHYKPYKDMLLDGYEKNKYGTKGENE